ncbi:MocR-like pyridoxine biosynthesis transcription factor PdxR [Phytoactinopolyspora halotolerans]|uniref:PLP-dependent aminotransferase family protein n=1 Tax=Phytoactinopolyspora halotolerans TaxID=1981512 RepID=A0A6L9SAP2_9ACTN|nr:PLP-dependent aminotransferase family protein [Phytoactinopolyspora halotolerans]NEE02207.1 PLP-dependent aminotransferase family protein [Phytoactinopolyspora halotolerans]
MIELPLIVNRDSAEPLARQLADQLRDAAARGLVRVGERLPSTRALATSLRVSRTVTAAAYEQLYAEGWLVAHRGSGTFLATRPAARLAARQAAGVARRGVVDHPAYQPGDHPAGTPANRTDDHADDPADDPSGLRADVRADDRAGVPGVVDLRPGSPWAAGVRPEVWRRAWRRAGDVEPDGRPLRTGVPAYRAAVEEHLLRHRGLSVDGAAVVATGGTTAAIAELAAAMLGAGETVAMEEPGYARAAAVLKAAGCRVVPVPVDADGVLVDAIPPGVRAVYCTPAHQFPLGARLPASRRVALVEWARQHGAWIIEDDYDGELRYDVAPLPLLAAIGPDVVIHVGSASKILTPSLGVGWMVAPDEVARAVVAYRDSRGVRPSPAGQRVLAAMAELGDLARHLRRVRRELAARYELVTRTLSAAGITVVGDRAGAHVVAILGPGTDEDRLVRAASDAGVLLEGIGRYFVGRPSFAGLALGFAAPGDQAELDQGLQLVLETLHASAEFAEAMKEFPI